MSRSVLAKLVLSHLVHLRTVVWNESVLFSPGLPVCLSLSVLEESFLLPLLLANCHITLLLVSSLAPPSHCVISCTALNESDLLPLDQCVPVSVLNESVLLPLNHCVSLSVC